MNRILQINIGLGVLSICGLGINEFVGTAIATPLRNQIQIIAQKFNQALYGLGLPKTAGTGGSVRLKDDVGGFESSGKTLPILALMVPEDGARTATSRPTVYWNMILNDPPQDYKLSFFVQESDASDSKVILEKEITITKGGLFKFELPQSVDANTPRRWGVKCKWASGKVVTANGILAYMEPKPETKIALDAAKTDLEKARIYASSGFWYDAIDTYSRLIKSNPQDITAIQEREKLITEGFKGHEGLNTKAFIAQLNIAPIQEFK